MNSFAFTPIFASGALQFAFEKATLEGKITIGCLLVLSLFSWTIIITKAWQLYKAGKVSKVFYETFGNTRDPLEIMRKAEKFEGSPAFEVYMSGAEELEYHLKNSSSSIEGKRRISGNSFDAVRSTLEEASAVEAMSLEKGMIVLSTAVAGGPFIGLLGTVWGVMETFAGIARANSASLTAMAPGVAGALIATVIGLLVAIPAMFAYNFMVTNIRGITQELDSFAIRLATQIEHAYVDTRPLSDEIKAANESLIEKIMGTMRSREEDERSADLASV